jgi:hypothetical protein
MSICCKKFDAQVEFDCTTAFKDTLHAVSDRNENVFFKMHCQSMIDVINAKSSFTATDLDFIKNTYFAFNNLADNANAKQLSTYLERKRPFIISWISSTDGQVSFSWLTPPANWDPDKIYPLYVQLHGNWSVASNTIEYMTYPYLNPASASFAFEDGYLLSPWARGNMWYMGISETDIWECIAKLEEHVSINPTRKYLCGHSMGGYGAWHIAHNSSNTWAAVGLHAAAIWYDMSEVSTYTAQEMKNVPVYFVCGNADSNLSTNQTLLNLLNSAGNQNLSFVTFSGGHDYRQVDVENMYLWMHNFVNDDYTSSTEVKANVNPLKLSAFPNPFSTKTLIKYSLTITSKVKL